jgi:dephospho-CoA kinase
MPRASGAAAAVRGPGSHAMLRVGLTGGIACGKSTVLRRLAVHGLATLDLDAVAREVMARGGAAHRDVVAAFGRAILDSDGNIDRPALAARIFGDAGARERLNAIVHPRVREEEARRAVQLESRGQPALVTDGALLVEAGVHLRFDRLVVVHCSPERQRRRLMARDGIGAGAARARIDAQMPIEEKRTFAHFEVDSSGALAETERAAEELAAELERLARSPRATVAVAGERALAALTHAGRGGPRGLGPRPFLEASIAAAGLDLSALARRLHPPAEIWYRAARAGEAGPWPEALVVPLVLWAGARGGDGDWLASASASLARLTHEDGEAVAGACLAAQAARAVAAGAALDTVSRRLHEWDATARRWGRSAPPLRVGRAVEVAVRHSADAAAARMAARAVGAEPVFAGALVGLAGSLSAATADPALVALLDRLPSE